MSQKTLYTGIAVTVTWLVVGVFFILGVPFSTQSLPGNAAALPTAQDQGQLQTQDEVTGTGPQAKAGDLITVNYTGKLQDGTTFDTSIGKQPYSFTLGAGQVIPGWDQGLVGAQVGTKRLLLVPPQLAYGPSDYGPIPGNSTLIFEVEVLAITPVASVPNLQNGAQQ